jgi:hypothetical protein
MAHIDRIWVHSPFKGINKISVYIKFSMGAEQAVAVEIPQDFYDCLLRMAQSAADLHEQKMRAEILAASALAAPTTQGESQ